MPHFRANGKLLLTAEYLVLDGAWALAVPTRPGQTLDVYHQPNTDSLYWHSLDHRGHCWLKLHIQPDELKHRPVTTDSLRKRLIEILQAAAEQNGDIWAEHLAGRQLQTRLEFDRNWGLGSSSTLIDLLAQYMKLDRFQLLADTFGGSGYDLACARARGPILYRLLPDEKGNFVLPQVASIKGVRESRSAYDWSDEASGNSADHRPAWSPDWLDQTYLVYLGRKQNSREGIAHYRTRSVSTHEIEQLNELTLALLESTRPAEVQRILYQHEKLVGHITRQQPVQQRLFGDFPGQIKSLGAWGGDFVWAVSEEEESAVRKYFSKRRFDTVFRYRELVLEST